MPVSRLPALGYPAMRAAWCRAALADFVKRWAIYLVMLVLLAAAGADGAWDVVVAIASWSVLPLFQAAAHPRWLAPVVALQAAGGVGLVWGMRPLLWPRAWADVERALPLPRDLVLRSDVAVVCAGLAPVGLVYAAGAVGLLTRRPAWLQGAEALALLGLALVWMLSVAGGVLLLQGMRRAPASGSASIEPPRRQPRNVVVKPRGWLRSLLWQPLWRGPALRSGRSLLLGSAAMAATCIGLGRWPDDAGWFFAAFAAVALAAVTRFNALLRLELTPLFDDCLALPLAPSMLERSRSLLALLPMAIGMALLPPALPAGPWRPGVFASYLASLVLGGAFETFTQPADPVGRSCRWLFFLVLAVVLASEVMR
jgi:hypothetical protein